ncbi:MAG: hypothetical protein ACKVVP_01690 [Chloroflexota bacterium]
MINDLSQAMASTDRDAAFGAELVQGIYATASPKAVFSEPVAHGEYMVITASEVGAAGGFGFGRGFGIDAAGNVSGLSQDASSRGGGGGGGGGGSAGGRPVAIIEIGPDGVKVKPVVDVTKFMLGAISAWVAIAVTLRHGRRFQWPWRGR